MTSPADLINTAIAHLGEDGPENTCVSNGAAKWCRESGIDYPSKTYSAADVTAALGEEYGKKSTDHNVTAIATMGKRGDNGFAWIEPDDIALGDLLIWPDYDHVSVATDDLDGAIRSIGSGTPSGKVSYQPESGGGNPRGFFIGAVRPPFQAAEPAPAAPAEPAPEATGERTRTIIPGDTLWGIAVEEYGDGARYVDIWAATQASSHPLRSGHPDLIYPGEIVTLP